MTSFVGQPMLKASEAATTQNGIAASAARTGVDRQTPGAGDPASAPAMIGTYTPARILSDFR